MNLSPRPLRFAAPFPNFVPEGLLEIAQRFNAGIAVQNGRVPKGRLNWSVRLNRPFGTGWSGRVAPSVETLGYCQMSPPEQNPSSIRIT
jgi:hypothetical protein